MNEAFFMIIEAQLVRPVGKDLKKSLLQHFIKGTLGPDAMMSRPIYQLERRVRMYEHLF